MMQLVVDGLLVNYIDKGTGPTILFLHGWGDNSKGLLPLIQDLKKNYRVIAPDLPGFGQSQAPDEAWGLDEYANFVGSFIKKCDVSPAVLIGHSNGGAIAIRAVARGNFNPDKLILIASSGIRGEYKGRRKALRLAAKTGKLLTTPLPQDVRKKLQRRAYQTIGSDMLVVEHLQDSYKKIITDDVRNDAANIQIPTLLIYGEKDTSTPVRHGEIFQRQIKGSKLTTFPHSGHFVQHDEPQKALEYIREFIQ